MSRSSARDAGKTSRISYSRIIRSFVAGLGGAAAAFILLVLLARTVRAPTYVVFVIVGVVGLVPIVANRWRAFGVGMLLGNFFYLLAAVGLAGTTDVLLRHTPGRWSY